jgi:DNA invertase Pin-like site-specific DNA recombinase
MSANGKSASPGKRRAYIYIRVSSSQQNTGHGPDRQREICQKAAVEAGFLIDQASFYEDLGVSAFNGANHKQGQLGQLHTDIQTGKIPSGSFLFVENVDRLSRQEPLAAMALIGGLVAGGMRIFCVHNQTEVTSNLGDFLSTVVGQTLAHQESAKKQERQLEAWKAKRKKANKQRLTKVAPSWLRPNEASRSGEFFKVVPEKAAIVKRIFDMCIDGYGAHAIATSLNNERLPSIGQGQSWAKSSIRKILTNRAVLGEFQPHIKNGTRRTAAGAPIGDYFPRIIEDADFAKAQQACADRKIRGGGRTGKSVSNLFRGVAVCGCCSGPMEYENHGAPPRGGRYLVCQNSKRNRCASGNRWHYQHFEETFTSLIETPNLMSLLGPSSGDAERNRLEELAGRLQSEAAEVRRKKDNLVLLAAEDANSGAALMDSINGFQEQLESLNEKVHKANAQLQLHLSQKQGLQDLTKSLTELLNRLSPDTAGSFDIRIKARQAISSSIEKVFVFPDGMQTLTSASSSEPLLLEIRKLMCNRNLMGRDKRFLWVRTKQGRWEYVVPKPANPRLALDRWAS